MTSHLLGVDTGGTYTDAVVYDDATDRVVAKAKAPTTHDDLAVGIGAAIDAVLAEGGVGADAIGLVSLSTTLATNALVESKGRRACLVLIGFDEDALTRGGLDAAAAEDELITATGGHTSHGDEAAPLDLDAVAAAVDAIAPVVDAFAVTAQFSVRNTSHEVAVRDLIWERTGLPVTCSHELSDALNGPKRAVTALLNARLVALVNELVQAAETMLDERGITAPVMVVRGDGSLVATDFVRDRPIETILSGPAASLIGAAHLTGNRDAIIADIGGTTTDIAVLRDGRPRLSPHGAVVGGHQTMVAAVSMHTHGIGGDSEIALADRAVGAQLTLGPRRLIPLARAALDAPELVHDTIARQLGTDVPGELDGVFVFPAARTERTPVSGRAERALLDRLADDGPIAADALVRSRIDLRAMARLGRIGLVRMAGLTPTDAAHVLGHQADLDTSAATLGARLFARRRDRLGQPIAADERALSEVIVATLVRRSAEALLAAALDGDGISSDAATSVLVAAAFDRTADAARIDIGVSVPIVGLGAPAATYYPEVAALLDAPCVVPRDADVANAIGAAIGQVRVRRTVAVSAPRRGVFRVHTGEEPTTYYDLADARAVAESEARRAAVDGAERAGARGIEVEIEWTERSATIEDKPYFVEGTLTAVAVGRPAVR